MDSFDGPAREALRRDLCAVRGRRDLNMAVLNDGNQESGQKDGALGVIWWQLAEGRELEQMFDDGRRIEAQHPP